MEKIKFEIDYHSIKNIDFEVTLKIKKNKPVLVFKCDYLIGGEAFWTIQKIDFDNIDNDMELLKEYALYLLKMYKDNGKIIKKMLKNQLTENYKL